MISHRNITPVPLVDMHFLLVSSNEYLTSVAALSVCHRLVQVCWSALLGALTPMLTKNHPMDSDVTSSNLILSNTISEKLIETHELVFQGLKLVFRLAVNVGTLHHWSVDNE